MPLWITNNVNLLPNIHEWTECNSWKKSFFLKKMVYDEIRRNSRPKLRPVLDAALNNLFFQKLFLP